MEKITRRGFVAGTGAAAAALSVPVALADEPASKPVTGMAACDNGKKYSFYEPIPGHVAFEADPIPEDLVEEVIDADIVVVGSGMAGAATALACSDAGLKTVIFEKNESFTFRGSEIGCLNGEFVASQGGVFDEELYYNEAMNLGQYRVNPNVWRAWIANCGKAVDWLLNTLGDSVTPYLNIGENGECMVETGGLYSFRDQVRFKEGIFGCGSAIVEAAIQKGADYRTLTPGVQLITDESGSVTGIYAKNLATEKYIRANASKGVVLCTGSYENNFELMREYIAPQDLVTACWRLNTQENTGDGLLMAQAIGAGVDDYPHVLMRDDAGSVKAHDVNRALFLPWPRVNESGLRFINESIATCYMANAVSAQAGAHDWALYCAPNGLDALVDQVPYTTCTLSIGGYAPEQVVELLERDAEVFDTIEEMAQGLGIDEANLKATIARLQELYEAGEDLDWHSDPGYLMDWSQGPYYAVEEAGAPMVIVSGLTINEKSEVLTPEGAVIPGLFAVGNASGSMFAGTYPHVLNGISHGRCVTFGYMLAQRLSGKA